MDDFGTGYMSVGRRKEMSIGEVKIAPSFVAGVVTNSDTALIVHSAVDLLRGLGIRSVAEGVESPQVAAALRGMGCDAAPGLGGEWLLYALAASARPGAPMPWTLRFPARPRGL